jgi:hypothetical protein
VAAAVAACSPACQHISCMAFWSGT